jgi:putative transposase
VSAGDVAAVIRDAICRRWTPKPLTIGTLQYPKEGGFPSGVIPAAEGALWSVTMLDGALANLASKIHETVRRATGFVINWGPPGHFERRPNVERTFKRIAEDFFHRLPSTTGSNPHAGRSPDASGAAKKHRLRASEMEQLIDVVLATHNAVPGSRNSFNSPLDTLRYFLSGPTAGCMMRKLRSVATSGKRSMLRTEICTVRGGVEAGRRPYIQFENVHYTNATLGYAAGLVGTRLTIYIDEDDLRQVTAFLPNGAELGILTAKGRWGVTKHDLTTRQAIFRLVSKRILVLSEIQDPIQAYLQYLADRAVAAKKQKTPSAKDATHALKVATDADVVPLLGKQAEVAGNEPLPEAPPQRRGRPLLPPPAGQESLKEVSWPQKSENRPRRRQRILAW